MENTPPPTHKLYTPGQIALAAFLGSPLAACWFFSRNCLQLGQTRDARRYLIGGAIGTAALFGMAYFLPPSFPSPVIPMSYTIGVLQGARREYRTIIEQHLSAGGRLGSWWTVISVSLLCVVIIFAVALSFSLLFSDHY